MYPNNNPIINSQLILWYNSKDRSDFISITWIFCLPIRVLKKQICVFKFYTSTNWHYIRFCNSHLRLVSRQLALKFINSYGWIIEWLFNIGINLILAFNLQKHFSLWNFIRWLVSLLFKQIKWHRSKSKQISAIWIPFYCSSRVCGRRSG